MKVHVGARSARSAKAFRDNNPSLSLYEHTGLDSLFTLLNHIIHQCNEDVALFCHDDVYFPECIEKSVQDLICELNARWPNWGICGNAGVSALNFGIDARKVIRFISDPHGGPNAAGEKIPCQTIDGNAILLNCRSLRANGVRVPEWTGFQLYDIVLSLETLSRGLGVMAAPELSCFHASSGNQGAFDSAANSETFRRYLSQKIKNNRISTINGSILVSGNTARPEALTIGSIDIELSALRAAADRRSTPVLAMIVRSQFRDITLLQRTLLTMLAFTTSAGSAIRCKMYVVSDQTHENWEDVKQKRAIFSQVDFMQAHTGREGDTRALLVRESLLNIDADFFWFIDDDDWLFPNEAERVALTIQAAPDNAIIFVDTMHFVEEIQTESGICTNNYKCNPARRFEAVRWRDALKGENTIPFCGMILSRSVVKRLPMDLLSRVTYYEDYALLLASLFHGNAFAIVIDKLVAGISVRSNAAKGSMLANSVTASDRTVWNRSLAELVGYMSQAKSLAPLHCYMAVSPQRPDAMVPHLTRKDRRLLKNAQFLSGALNLLVEWKRWRSRRTCLFHAFREGGARAVRRLLRNFSSESVHR